MSKEAENNFKEWCKSIGIDQVYSDTAFRFDEVIEFGKYHHQKQWRERERELIEGGIKFMVDSVINREKAQREFEELIQKHTNKTKTS